MQPNEFLRTPEAARALGLSISTMTKMRLRGDGPIYLKLGPRAVAYDPRDLQAWAELRRRRSTSDPGKGEA